METTYKPTYEQYKDFLRDEIPAVVRYEPFTYFFCFSSIFLIDFYIVGWYSLFTKNERRDTMKLYTVNGCGDVEAVGGFFNSFTEAKQAWEAAGKPTQHGSDVWVSDYDTVTYETTSSVTIN